MTHVISPAPAQPPTSRHSGFPNNSFRRAATMFISLCAVRCNTWMEVGESYQPKYYLLMVASRCWAGKGLGCRLCITTSLRVCQLTTAQVQWCSGAVVPIMLHAELSEFPDSSHSHGHGPGAAECSSWSQPGEMWNLLEDWPGPAPGLGWAAPGLGWAGLGWAGWLIFSGFGRPPRVMRSWWTDS